MKKLIAMSVLFMAGIVFSQEPEVAPAEPPKCDADMVKPCEEQLPPKCDGEEMKRPRRGEFPRQGRQMGNRQDRPRHEMGGGLRQRPKFNKFKKCECCPECKGVIILPPDAEEGEPIFKLLGGEGRGRRPARGPRPEYGNGPKHRRPNGPRPELPDSPSPEGPAEDSPKGE